MARTDEANAPAEKQRPGLPHARPLPDSIRGIADLAWRQRAADAWRAASRLRRLMEAWETWFAELTRTGDADPGLALRLHEEVAVCVQALCQLQGTMVTFSRCTPADLLPRFPHAPAAVLRPPWQQDQEYRRQTQALITRDEWSLLLGELQGFMQLLETAPSVALPAQPPRSLALDEVQVSSKPKSKRGRRPDTDFKEERRVAQAWQTGAYKTYAECGQALGKSKHEVERALDNYRHRSKRQPPKSA